MGSPHETVAIVNVVIVIVIIIVIVIFSISTIFQSTLCPSGPGWQFLPPKHTFFHVHPQYTPCTHVSSTPFHFYSSCPGMLLEWTHKLRSSLLQDFPSWIYQMRYGFQSWQSRLSLAPPPPHRLVASLISYCLGTFLQAVLVIVLWIHTLVGLM